MVDIDPRSIFLTQPPLFELREPSTGSLELFPAVWSAAERILHPDPLTRRPALEQLAEMGAVRLSPLAAYILATRLRDPDLAIRTRAVQILGEMLLTKDPGRAATEGVRQYLTASLAQMRTRQAFSLLEVVDQNPATEEQVAVLLIACPFAGTHLAHILADRRAPLPVRKQAAHFIGRAGYLDAAAALERLAARLQVRLNGQQAMPFAPQEKVDEVELLPAVMAALHSLKAP